LIIRSPTLGIPTVLMGFALPDHRMHAPNEKFHLPNFYKGDRDQHLVPA
jgi:acetylornithine deacetylase/succinyl-diaminopimelate desuccinylase-like protein